MAAFGFAYTNGFSSCSMAAAGTSAPMIPILDTAVSLVVSICIVLVRITGAA